jgi:REP element-mobilizing transposase RayT
MIDIGKGPIQIVSGNVRQNHIHMLVSAPTDISRAKIAQF